MKTIMLKSLFIISAFYALNVNAQLVSYSDNLFPIKIYFEATFAERNKTDVPAKFIIGAKDNFELGLKVGPFTESGLNTALNDTYIESDCESCKQKDETLTNAPLKYIFDIIQNQDVFFVPKFKDEFKVIRYQPEEEQ